MSIEYLSDITTFAQQAQPFWLGTAALSQYLLDSGHQFCFLHTDLANSTSNKIYQAIGYRLIGDALLIRFLSPEG